MSKVIAVTGASGGIGRASARRFAAPGKTVVLVARGERGLQGVAEEVEAAGGKAVVLAVDVADFPAVRRAIDRIESDVGELDVLVNAAFTSVFAPFDKIDAQEYRRITEVTYLGYVHTTMAALPYFKRRDRGTIVQVGSALAYRGIPLQTAYSGAKHAIQGFHEALRCELLHERSNVRTTMVQMPAVNTPQFSWVLNRLPRHAQPVPPIYQPEVAARAVVFAAEHPNRREYWVGSSTVGTLVANAVAPGLLDRYLARTGIRAQQIDRPPPAGGNLWSAADGSAGSDFGAHGEFDDRSHEKDPQLWLSEHHGLVGVGLVAAGLLGVSRVRRR